MGERYVTIVGAVNIDIIGRPKKVLNPNDSNPGKTILALGGVARNITENLSRLGVATKFITVLGNDAYATEIINSCRELDINLDHSLIMEGERTSTYLCINDKDGEMEVAISDMEIYRHLTPSYLKGKLEIINKGLACIIDTNIPKDSLVFLMDNCKVPIFLDTVSTSKTNMIKDSLRNIHTLKPNIMEAEILSGMKIQTEEDFHIATDIILKKGVKRIFMTLGPQGVFYTDGINKGIIPPIPTEIINVTGAGDSFMAAVTWAYLNNLNIKESAQAGLAASYICVRSSITVSQDMSAEKIKNIMKNNWR